MKTCYDFTIVVYTSISKDRLSLSIRLSLTTDSYHGRGCTGLDIGLGTA